MQLLSSKIFHGSWYVHAKCRVYNYSSMESRYKAMATHETNEKIFNWVETNSNGRCQNWKHRVNKMIKEVNIQYQSGDTNSVTFKVIIY